MTKSEYVRLSRPERVYGQKHLLSAQLEMLDLIKRFHNYKNLRNEELVLKVTLKNKVEETMNMIDKLEKTLPKAHYHEPSPEEREKERKKEEKKLTLQEEIDRIRDKLSRLRQS